MHAIYLRSSPNNDWIWVGLCKDEAEALEYASWMESRRRSRGWPLAQCVVEEIDSAFHELPFTDSELTPKSTSDMLALAAAE